MIILVAVRREVVLVRQMLLVLAILLRREGEVTWLIFRGEGEMVVLLYIYIWRVSEPAKNSTEICPISDFSFDTITFAPFV